MEFKFSLAANLEKMTIKFKCADDFIMVSEFLEKESNRVAFGKKTKIEIKKAEKGAKDREISVSDIDKSLD